MNIIATKKISNMNFTPQINSSAKALIELGLEPNRSVAVLGNNSPEWFSSAVGAVFGG